MYLVAWRAGGLAGRCTVLTASKYDKVRRLLGAFPEMNALEARATRTGHRERRSSPVLSTWPGSAGQDYPGAVARCTGWPSSMSLEGSSADKNAAASAARLGGTLRVWCWSEDSNQSAKNQGCRTYHIGIDRPAAGKRRDDYGDDQRDESNAEEYDHHGINPTWLTARSGLCRGNLSAAASIFGLISVPLGGFGRALRLLCRLRARTRRCLTAIRASLSAVASVFSPVSVPLGRLCRVVRLLCRLHGNGRRIGSTTIWHEYPSPFPARLARSLSHSLTVMCS